MAQVKPILAITMLSGEISLLGETVVDWGGVEMDVIEFEANSQAQVDNFLVLKD